MGTDDDVLQLADQLLEDLRPGAIVVNQGTGLPGNAVRLTELCAKGGVEVLDAPVSGGRPAAQERPADRDGRRPASGGRTLHTGVPLVLPPGGAPR
ncbi:NAD(P)-binding domain-containing protein [Streptomyces sp. RS10V-4]|uniref:NAD(P)-binding domain-containing protein n=1 Tax=Streptomyces rhizoryzae TaxID=2932493 RepID=UPI002005B355|nr:NAD(P)-binding domain-containing protein [Streptomyces rhizoryzae]MCK7621606.1 NAD(P)-binding domain-containing protein [Streptomyces rhizoryzae]